MRYVLLKLSDEATRKLVKKAGGKAVGVWDAPEEFCQCPKWRQAQAKNWAVDAETYQRFCLVCGNANLPVTTLITRLRIAFLSRNLIRMYRG